jgi:hypothetical protein
LYTAKVVDISTLEGGVGGGVAEKKGGQGRDLIDWNETKKRIGANRVNREKPVYCSSGCVQATVYACLKWICLYRFL